MGKTCVRAVFGMVKNLAVHVLFGILFFDKFVKGSCLVEKEMVT